MPRAGRARFSQKRGEASASRCNGVGNQARRASIHPTPRTSTSRTLTPRTSWRMTFTLSDASAVYATSFANVTVVHRRGTGGPDYEETFNDGAAQGWTPQGGQWSAATGDLRNATNTSFTSNTIDGIELPDQFVMLADVYLSWGASGNTAGLLFNYHGPGDFYELRLNAQGTARLSEVRGGVRRTIFSLPYPNAGTRRLAHDLPEAYRLSRRGDRDPHQRRTGAPSTYRLPRSRLFLSWEARPESSRAGISRASTT